MKLRSGNSQVYIHSIERVVDAAAGTGPKVLKAELSDMLAFLAS
jgi:hypothetical protein